MELSYKEQFDYLVKNINLKDAVNEVKKIIEKEI